MTPISIKISTNQDTLNPNLSFNTIRHFLSIHIKKYSLTPVSYTHLDVYKRQGFDHMYLDTNMVHRLHKALTQLIYEEN